MTAMFVDATGTLPVVTKKLELGEDTLLYVAFEKQGLK